MNTKEVKYEIKNVEGKNIEKGYVITKTVPDKLEIYVEKAKGFLVSRNPYTGEYADIDANFFIEALRDCLYGKKREYEENGYKIIIN